MIDRNGGDPRRITSSGSENVDPDWGRNGFSAYSSRVGGAYQICVLNPETLDFGKSAAGTATTKTLHGRPTAGISSVPHPQSHFTPFRVTA